MFFLSDYLIQSYFSRWIAQTSKINYFYRNQFFLMESISVFDIIKIGIGPSSSHTMGPWNAAKMFLDLVKRNHSLHDVKEVFVEFFGSLAKTGVGHGTDIAGMLGLSGENFRTIDTNKIDEKIKDQQIINIQLYIISLI